MQDWAANYFLMRIDMHGKERYPINITKMIGR